MEKLKGFVRWFFETGCEGVCWVFEEDSKKGYGALHCLKAGDWLKIYNKDGSVAFEGEIVEDHKTGWAEYPKKPGHGQPCALGFWIHWTQKGWKPDDWARLFARMKGEEYLRAELVKRQAFKKRSK